MKRNFALFALFVSLVVTSPAIAQTGLKRITIASAVRVRSGPSTTATVLETLSIGVLLDEAGRSPQTERIGEMQDYWYRVVLPGKKEGWVFGGLTQAVDPAAVDDAYLRIAAERLAKNDLNFADRTDAVEFLSRASREANSREAKGRLELAHLQMVQATSDTIPFDKRGQAPYRAWISKLESSTIRFDEIQGTFLVKDALYWAVAKKYADTKAGDDLAWTAAEAQLGGECEGDLSCNLAAFNMTRGRYLASYPDGAHAGEAVQNFVAYLEETLQGIRAEPGAYAAGDGDGAWVADYRRNLAETRATLKKTGVAGRDKALALLDDVEKLSLK